MKKFAKLLAVFMALAMLAGVMTSCDLLPFDENGNFVGFDKIFDLVTGKTNADFMESEHHTVTAGMLKYYFVSDYMSFRSQYGQYLSYVGIDENMPLDRQMCDQNSILNIAGSFSGSWFDFFMERTVADIEKTLRFCEYAHDNGIFSETMISEEQISNALTFIKDAPNSVMDIASSITEDDIANAMALSIIAKNAEEHLRTYLGDSISEKEIENRYHSNKQAYDVVDFVSYTFSAPADDAETIRQNESDAQNLSSQTTFEGFAKFITEREGVSADGISDYLHLRQKNDSLSKDVAAWAFNCPVGGTYTVTEDSDSKDGKGEHSITVYMLTQAPYAMKTKNFSYMSFDDEMTAINAINDYLSGTVHSFGELSNIYKALEYKTLTNYDDTAASLVGENSIIVTYPINGSVSGDKFHYSYADGAVTIAPKYYTVTGGDSAASYYITSTDKAVDKYYVSAGDKLTTDYFVSADGAFNKYIYSANIGDLIVNPNVSLNAVTTVINADLAKWVFDGARQAGDFTDKPIVGTDSRFYVAFFEGDGEYSWYASIKNELVTEAFEQAVAELSQRYSVNTLSDANDIAN